MTNEDYAQKIAGLLAKAEDPAVTAEESQTFLAGAQRLMAKYAISQAMIDAASGEAERTVIIEEDLAFTGPYKKAHQQLLYVIARANGVKSVGDGGSSGVIHLIGFEEDVRQVVMLNTSAQIQSTGGMMKWYGEQPWRDWSGGRRFKAKREWLYSFARAVGTRLAKETREAREEYEAEHEEDATISESVALVVHSKEQKVQDWIDVKYGKLVTSHTRRSYGGREAAGAGFAAGMKADLGQGGRVGGSVRELGS